MAAAIGLSDLFNFDPRGWLFPLVHAFLNATLYLLMRLCPCEGYWMDRLNGDFTIRDNLWMLVLTFLYVASVIVGFSEPLLWWKYPIKIAAFLFSITVFPPVILIGCSAWFIIDSLVFYPIKKLYTLILGISRIKRALFDYRQKRYLKHRVKVLCDGYDDIYEHYHACKKNDQGEPY